MTLKFCAFCNLEIEESQLIIDHEKCYHVECLEELESLHEDDYPEESYYEDYIDDYEDDIDDYEDDIDEEKLCDSDCESDYESDYE